MAIMNSESRNGVLGSLIESLELPDSAYEKAAARYDDLGEWLCRDNSSCCHYDPHIFPQGSFRLGTAIRPIDENEPYDLDLVCKFRKGIEKSTHTQQDVKRLLGYEVESYRIARGIKEQKEEMHRCWRIHYADTMSFHMDIVPCIPETADCRMSIRKSMLENGLSKSLAQSASELAVSITDDRHGSYKEICEDWEISNPEGYADWFADRMMQAQDFLLKQDQLIKAGTVDDLPLYQWKTPLQQAIQLLKRHRDQMFRDYNDVKPISIIITTLAANAYQGESDIESAIDNILMHMDKLVSPQSPRVPNPVDRNEDFADRWAMPKYAHLKLEQHFWRWLTQAKADFGIIRSSGDVKFITAQAEQKYAVHLNEADLAKSLSIAAHSVVAYAPKTHVITQPARPWVKHNN